MRGISNDSPLYWARIQISINSIYLFCIIDPPITVWRLKKSSEKCQNRTFYLLFTSMLLIGRQRYSQYPPCHYSSSMHTLASITKCSKGIFALFYFPGETVLITTIFSVLYNRFQSINLGTISNRIPVIKSLYQFIVGISFVLFTILIVANFIHAKDVISAANNSYPPNPVRLATSV